VLRCAAALPQCEQISIIYLTHPDHAHLRHATRLLLPNASAGNVKPVASPGFAAKRGTKVTGCLYEATVDIGL